MNEEYDELDKQYNGEIPHDIEKDFYDKIDKNLTSQLSRQFMNDVNDFYMNALELSN